tara:strand:- start:11270 stop:13657 length:2388 start_codon:yes stop_codon:yes gene_type:complete
MGNPLQGRFKAAGGGGWTEANNITRSAWFDGSADYLSRSSVTGTSTRKWSIFGAFRVTDFSARSRYIFECASGTSSQTALLLRAEQDLQFFDYSGGSVNAAVYSDGLIRDSEWYTFLCVCDTANASAALRWRLYVNEVEQSTNRTNPSLNYDTSWNDGTSQHIGVQSYSSLQNYWEGSFAAILHADNTALTPSDVLDSHTVGTNGSVHYLKSEADLKALANAGGTASFFLASDIGDGTDDSSKGNNFTASSMSDAANGSDDTPTDPLPIFNPLLRGGGNVYFEEGGAVGGSADGSEANLLVVTPGFYSGKHVIEFDIANNASGYPKVGLVDAATMRDDSVHATSGSHELGSAAVPGSYGYDPSGAILHEGSTIDSSPASFTTNDHIAIEVDLNSNVIRWYKGGSLQSTTSSAGLEAPVFFAMDAYNNADARIVAKVADMTHTPTTGYTPPKYSNLAKPGTQGADVFQTLLYTGNAADNRDITGAGFQPDFMWHKRRNGSQSHKLIDSSRGVTKVVASDVNSAEATEAGLDSFQTDGIRVDNADSTNDSGATYAAWLWKINGGTTASNGNGSITTTVQVASEGHISVATFTATGSAATYGHGLSGAPDFVTIKRRNGTDAWYTWMQGMGGTQYLTLDTTDAVATNSAVYTALPTSTVVNGGTIFGAGTYVMYCFRNVPGLLQAGEYVGNGNVDGPVILTGFKIRFLLIKGSGSGQEWQIYDTARNVTNDDSSVYLQADSDGAEGTDHKDLDLLSTGGGGFKLRDTTSTLNTSGTSYFYVAIADVATGTGLPPIPGR